MKTFEVLIPLVVTEIIEVEAETEQEALDMVYEQVSGGEHELEHDPEGFDTWWAEEK